MSDHLDGSGRRMRERVASSTTLRLLVIGVLVLLMLIPLSMVESIVAERQLTYADVLAEISAHWGSEQVLTGPILVVPFTERHQVSETRQDQTGKTYVVNSVVQETYRAALLPGTVSLDGEIRPEYRRRGIYQSLVYTQDVRLSGSFSAVEEQLRSLSSPDKLHAIHWEKAFLAVGLSDPRGIARAAPLVFSEQQVALAPGTGVPELLPNGFQAPVGVTATGRASFDIELQLKGSYGFRLAPLGELTEMRITSPWAHPSFYGDVLPRERQINDRGFEASWSIPHLVRSYPQRWVLERSDYAPSSFSAGVRLFEPVTLYTEATRAVKYGFIFIALTFLVLVLMEIAAGVRPSMVQYAMIGVALSMFFLLLIALSEHLGFNLAYLLAAASVIVLNGSYSAAVLGRGRLAAVVAAVLGALYTVLFTVLRTEDYALLAGSILLFFALAVTMYFTRHLHRLGDPPRRSG